MSSNESYLPRTKEEILERLQEVASGLQSPQSTVTTLTVQTTTYSKADLTKLVLGWIAVFMAVNQALTAYHDAVSARNTLTPTVKEFMEDLLMALQNTVGKSETALALYGFRPKKEATPLTVSEKSAKLRKTRETREENHTLGKDQKKALDQGATPEPGASGSGNKS
jgi:hypothetical protein